MPHEHLFLVSILVFLKTIGDLHLELQRGGPSELDVYEYNFPARTENLAILGDLGLTYDSRFFDWLEQQLRRFCRVCLVPENHEPYKSTLVSCHNSQPLPEPG